MSFSHKSGIYSAIKLSPVDLSIYRSWEWTFTPSYIISKHLKVLVSHHGQNAVLEVFLPWPDSKLTMLNIGPIYQLQVALTHKHWQLLAFNNMHQSKPDMCTSLCGSGDVGQFLAGSREGQRRTSDCVSVQLFVTVTWQDITPWWQNGNTFPNKKRASSLSRHEKKITVRTWFMENKLLELFYHNIQFHHKYYDFL